jgi:hypothetical protein
MARKATKLGAPAPPVEIDRAMGAALAEALFTRRVRIREPAAPRNNPLEGLDTPPCMRDDAFDGRAD